MGTYAKIFILLIALSLLLTGIQFVVFMINKNSYSGPRKQNYNLVVHEAARTLATSNYSGIRKHDDSWKGYETIRTLPSGESSIKLSHTNDSLVPNIVHYIWVDLNGTYTFTFLYAVSFISVHKNWRPEEILVHINKNNQPKGRWWDYVTSIVTTKIRFLSYDMREIRIFGAKPRYVEHISDIMRLLLLKEYGGTYIDNDVIALRSLDPLRHYNHTQGVGLVTSALSNGVIIAKKTSRFLSIWLEEYKTYGKKEVYNLWGHYSVSKPRQLIKKHPGLVRIERDTLVRPDMSDYRKLETRKRVWKYSYSMHVWRRFIYIPRRPEDIKRISNQSLLRDVMEYVIFDKIPYYAQNDTKLA